MYTECSKTIPTLYGRQKPTSLITVSAIFFVFQIQKVAHQVGGPDFAQHITALQIQGQTQQVDDNTSRRAQAAAVRISQAQQQQSQPQYLQEVLLTQRAAPTYNPQAIQRISEDNKEREEDDQYDVSKKHNQLLRY